ncbi:MAG: hypothetical protein QG564_726 [Campylobacterota bacterium]|nr:hypothetical protein [Campylobacterota bacterium]
MYWKKVMKNKYYFSLIAFILSTIVCFGVSNDTKTPKMMTSANPDTTFTPIPGSLVRKKILHTLRKEISRTQGVETVFVVKYLKVKGDWAWIHVLPQSSGGINRYEDISALLHFQHGEWAIAELPCTETENPECLDDPGYFAGLKKRFPQLPVQILPDE